MITIKNMADLKAWLEGAPGHWPTAIAARAALRALPLIHSEIEDIETVKHWRNFLILPTFRANLISVFVAKYPNVKIGMEVFKNATDSLVGIDIEAIDAAFYTVLFAGTNEYGTFESAIACASRAAMNDFLFWQAVEVDADFLQSGEDVWSLPLWPVDFPQDFDKHWIALKRKLIYRAPYWQVLTRWYEDCLRGGSEVERSNPKTDLQIATLRNEIWLSGKRANQVIGTIQATEWSDDEEDAPETDASVEQPRIPEQKPAALEPIWLNNRLQLSGGALQADLASDPLSAALGALKLDLEALVSDAQTVSNIDQRLVGYLDHIAGIVPISAPDQASLFRLGHAFEPIRLALGTVQAEWPDVLGFRFSGLLLAFERTLKQFPDWRQFTKIADDIHLTEAEIAAAPKLAEQLIEALREPEVAEVVAPEIPNELEALVNGEIDPSWNGEFGSMSEQRAIDTIESSSNIMKRFLEPVFDGFKTRDEGAKGVRYTVGKSVHAALQKEAENAGPAMMKYAKRLLKFGVPGAAAASYTSFSQLDWLKPIVEFLKTHSGL
jgi:hypothetical protein